MPSRHETVKLRSRNRHVTVTPLRRPEPPALWQLDLVNERLRRGDETLALPPKVFAVLRYLHEYPGRLVTKQELLDGVWPDIAVTEAVLKNCILKLREVLGDNAKSPRYIETIHRRGYRLLASLATSIPPVQGSTFDVQGPKTVLTPSPQHPAPMLVGRDAELAQLHGWLDKALNGVRQLSFVTGEPGIGKTSVVEAFLSGIGGQGTGNSIPTPTDPQSPIPVPWITWGQCIEHFGAGEAYLPVLTALGHLCRGPEGQQLVSLLSQHAPAWLVQMPAVLTEEELATLQRKTAGVTKERMLREMAEALEVITAERPLVLVLEDLHWSDPSTLDFLAFVARRSQSARLLLIGTYRPSEMLAAEHPLRGVVQELQLHKQCEELALPLLTEGEVAQYVAARLGAPAPASAGEGGGESQSNEIALRSPLPLSLAHGERGPRDPDTFTDLAWAIHQRTEGNPLFMVNVVDDVVAQGSLEHAHVEISAPPTIRQMIERHVDRLDPADQQLIETASVAGMEFSAAAVAAGAQVQVEEVERRCAALERQGQFLNCTGVSEWPDGTVASRYAFQHALYQEVLYECVTAAQQVMLHRRIGERIEAAYGNRASEVATELAVHFERGQDYQRAVRYLQRAGERASQRSAYMEAISHLTMGLELLKALPDSPECILQELALQTSLGALLIATKGYTAPEVEGAYARALALCRHLGETPQRFLVLRGLQVFYLLRAEYHTAHELAEQLFSFAQHQQDPAFLVGAHLALGQSFYWQGEFNQARAHLEQGIALCDRQQPHFPAWPGGHPKMHCFLYAAWALWFLGYPDRALRGSHEAVVLTRELSSPFNLAHALAFATIGCQFRREEQKAQALAEEVLALTTQHGFSVWAVMVTILRGWVLAMQGQTEEGIAQIRQGLAAYQATGAELMRPHYLALLAEAYGRAGQPEAGLTVLVDALAQVDKTGERFYEVELYRLKGELTLQKEPRDWRLGTSPSSPQATSLEPQVSSEVETCFLKAIAVAQHQQAKSLELRATVSLARLWRRQGREKEAHQILSEIYHWFTEGFDTVDLKEAKVLLEEIDEARKIGVS